MSAAAGPSQVPPPIPPGGTRPEEEPAEAANDCAVIPGSDEGPLAGEEIAAVAEPEVSVDPGDEGAKKSTSFLKWLVIAAIIFMLGVLSVSGLVVFCDSGHSACAPLEPLISRVLDWLK